MFIMADKEPNFEQVQLNSTLSKWHIHAVNQKAGACIFQMIQVSTSDDDPTKTCFLLCFFFNSMF